MLFSAVFRISRSISITSPLFIQHLQEMPDKRFHIIELTFLLLFADIELPVLFGRGLLLLLQAKMSGCIFHHEIQERTDA